jgi:hypothetical protein
VPCFVSVTIEYLWLHPIFDFLNLRPIHTPIFKPVITYQHWDTGSLVFDIPSDRELDPNGNLIHVLPWEEEWKEM